LSSGKLIRTLLGNTDYTNAAISGDYIVSAGWDDTIRVWSLSSGKLIRTLIGGYSRCVYSVAISGDYIVSGSIDDTIKIWSLSSGKLIRTLKGHTISIESVAINGNYIVSGDNDKTIKIWNILPSEKDKNELNLLTKLVEGYNKPLPISNFCESDKEKAKILKIPLMGFLLGQHFGFRQDKVVELICKHSSAYSIDKVYVNVNNGVKKWEFAVTNKKKCKFEIIFESENNGATFITTEKDRCKPKSKYKIGEKVYIFEEKTPGPFWGTKASYYYARATVDNISEDKIKILIIDKCSNNQIRGGIICEDNYNGNYKSGRYYWVDESALTKYPSNW
jgi:WD40 repeat protein